MPFDFFDKLVEPCLVSKKGLFLGAGSLMGFLAIKRRVMSIGGDSGLPFIEESWMIGHLLIFEEDLDSVP